MKFARPKIMPCPLKASQTSSTLVARPIAFVSRLPSAPSKYASPLLNNKTIYAYASAIILKSFSFKTRLASTLDRLASLTLISSTIFRLASPPSKIPKRK